MSNKEDKNKKNSNGLDGQNNPFNNNNNHQNNNKKNQPGTDTPKRPFNYLNVILMFLILTTFINIFAESYMNKQKVEIGYNQFIALVDNQHVKEVSLTEQEILIELKDDVDKTEIRNVLGMNLATEQAEQITKYEQQLELLQNARTTKIIYYTGNVQDPQLVERLIDNNVDFSTPIIKENLFLSFIMSWIIPIAIMYFIYSILMRNLAKKMGGSDGGGIGGMFGNPGKSKAKQFNVEEHTAVTFKDVAGQDEAKESLVEIIDFLHNPDKYRSIGAKQPKGALLVGPPGTGKTLLAKATAGEAKVPFFYISGSEFVEMFVGVGASRVRDLFEQANKQAPCIIFIDEIDAIGKSRDNRYGSNDEHEQTLNQLLAEMDGFDSTKGIVVLAATNRPEVLDKALLRPGRLDRQVIVDKPDLPGRKDILGVHIVKVKTGDDIDLDEIARSTSGATGADLANMVNEAALRAVRLGRKFVLQEDLQESVEVVIAGKEKKDRVLNEKERRMVAYHEVGHALASALQKHSTPVQKITIIPRTMGSLGYTMNVPEEERYLLTADELKAQIVTLLAGRAAEEVEFGVATTGASNDIERATKIARSMVTQYGMTDKFDMMGLETTQNQYLDGRNVSTASEATGKEIDIEVNKIIVECHEKAVELLAGNREALTNISEFLLEKETITGKQFMEILEITQSDAGIGYTDNAPTVLADTATVEPDITAVSTDTAPIDTSTEKTSEEIKNDTDTEA